MHVSNEVVKNVRVGSLIKSLSRLAESPEEINYRKKCSPLRGQLSRTDRKGDGKLGYNFTASLSLDSIRKTTKSHFFKVAARTKNTPREIWQESTHTTAASQKSQENGNRRRREGTCRGPLLNFSSAGKFKILQTNLSSFLQNIRRK